MAVGFGHLADPRHRLTLGTSTSAAQLGSKFAAFGMALADVGPALNRVGMSGKDIFATERSRVITGSTPVSSKIRERYDLRQREVMIRYTGPAHLINNPTSRHFIGARMLGTRSSLRNKSRNVGTIAAFGGSNRGAFGHFMQDVDFNRYGSQRQQAVKGTLRRRKGKRALTIGGNARAYAFHPGSPGKQFFQKAKASGYQKLPDVYKTAQIVEPMRRIFN